MHRRAFLGATAALALSGCASLSPKTLADLGSEVDDGTVDFAALHQSARRVHDSQKADAEIRRNWPNTVAAGRVTSVDVRYFVEQDHKTKVQHISMPGSLSLEDWLEDFDLLVTADKRSGVMFHHGFERSAKAAYAELRPRLDKGYRTHVNGHSMGAGVAAIMSLYLKEDGYNLTRTTTFGQPRVTNAAGAQLLAGLPITRVVNADDFVSMLPTFPFEHFGEEVILHAGNEYVYLAPASANQISIGEFWRQRHGLDIASHSTELYIARLAEKMKSASPVPYVKRLA
jgi:triacylglycerol lipase